MKKIARTSRISRSQKYKSKDKLPPGTVRPGPDQKGKQSPVFSIFAWNAENLEKYQIPAAGLADFELPANRTVWMHFPDIEHAEALEAVGSKFGIHSLVLEDIQNDDHRPKMEDYPEFNFVLQKQLIWDDENVRILVNQIAYIFKKDLVLTFARSDPFAPIRERLERKQGKVRDKKADYFLFSLLDVVSDDYFSAVDQLDNLLDEHEDDINTLKSQPDFRSILGLKKQVVKIKKNVRPFRTAVDKLRTSLSPPVQESNRLFYRDLADHLIQLMDALDGLILTVDSLISLGLNMASHQMNSVMKVLTVIATIFIPLTFIVGVYGMNFHYMPELSVPWAYPAVLGGMLVIGIIMLIIFKKKKWF